MGCRTGGQNGVWKISGQECCGGEGVMQDQVPDPVDGRLPIRLDVTHQHITTLYVREQLRFSGHPSLHALPRPPMTNVANLSPI
jgi:hypothetical protein